MSLLKINIMNAYLTCTHMYKHIKINLLILVFTECCFARHCNYDDNVTEIAHPMRAAQRVRTLMCSVHVIKVCAHLLCILCS
jgi:hypothetical protein